MAKTVPTVDDIPSPRVLSYEPKDLMMGRHTDRSSATHKPEQLPQEVLEDEGRTKWGK